MPILQKLHPFKFIPIYPVKSTAKIAALVFLLFFIALLLITYFALSNIANMPSLQIPFAVCLSVTLWSGIAASLCLTWLLWQYSPHRIKIFSILILCIGLVLIEIMHLNSSSGGYVFSDKSFVLISPDDVIDYQTFLCDSFGVTKYNRNSKSPHLPEVLNADGFKSRYAFEQRVLDSLKLCAELPYFFVGDSYTFGGIVGTANSFAGLIEKQPRMAVFNAGIPGTDPQQYVNIVREYIDARQLKPEEVVVCICGANDLYTPSRKCLPGVPMFYDTNSGLLYSDFSDTIYSSAAEVYRQTIKELSIVEPDHVLSQIINRSITLNVVQKVVLVAQLPLKFFSNRYYTATFLFLEEFIEINRGVRIKSNIGKYVTEIKRFCAQAGVPVRFFLLPDINMVQNKAAPHFDDVVSVPATIFEPSDFDGRYGFHPTKSGHRKIFGFIYNQLIQSRKK